VLLTTKDRTNKDVSEFYEKWAANFLYVETHKRNIYEILTHIAVDRSKIAIFYYPSCV